MSHFRSAILIVGLILFFVASALLTVIILYVSGVIVTDPIELVYSVDSIEKVYDGQPLTAEAYRLESGNILEGHTAEVVIKGSQTDAGRGESTLEVKVLDKNGFDVSREYSVKVISGDLIVIPQDITVSIKDTQATYNGNEVDFENYELLEGTLAAGHRIAAAAKTGIVNVGDRLDASELQPMVFNAQGVSVTQNYNINFDIDGVEVLPRPVTIVPENVTTTYDGTVIVADKYSVTAGSLVSGHYLNVKIVTTDGGAAEAQNVSSTHIKIGSVTITDESGAEVTRNYDIDYSETAYLTITKKSVTVVLNYVYGDDYVYTGTPITPEVTDALSDEALLNYDINTAEVEVVARGDSIDAGTYEYTVNYNNDYGNFDITFIPGSYTISKRSVTLSATSKERKVVYGGTYDFDINELICEDLTVSAANYTARNDVDGGVQILSFTGITVLNASNEDITSNLKIDLADFKITVQLAKRTLKFTYTECDITSYSMNNAILNGHVYYTQIANGDEITFEILVKEMTFEVDATTVRITDANGRNVTKLYDIDIGDGGAFIY